MRNFQFRPIAALQPYIDRLWGWESDRDEMLMLPTVLPGTGAELFFHYRTPFSHTAEGGNEEALPAAHLLCLRRKPIVLRASADVGFIAVRFRAGMLHRFTGIPAPELIDHPLAAAEVWPGTAKDISEQVALAVSAEAGAEKIQHFLMQQLQYGLGDSLAELAVSRIYRDCSGIAIDRLANDLGIGRRQLERRVKSLAGQSPSELRRAARFQRTVKALLLDPSARPLDLALVHGYYDQAHFIRDFKNFAKTSPLRYLATARAATHFYNTSWTTSLNMDTPFHSL